jgi:hypothetical protein
MYSARLWLSTSFLSIFMALQVWGQLPKSNIYMMDFAQIGDSIFFENPQFMTFFNQNGYNNQPSFFSDDLVFLTSNYYDPEKTEIIKLDISKSRLSRVTKTRQSEYSPTLMPNKKDFSCIRTEKDGKDQSLWKYPVDQSDGGQRLLDELSTVGYHCWISEEEVALFLVGDPLKLVIANIVSGSTKYLLNNIGRCLKLSPAGELIIVHKLLDNKWYLKKYDPLIGTFKIITETLPGKEDFGVLPDGAIIMANGSEIWKFDNSNIIDTWKKMDDLSNLGMKDITRISISSNKILFVENKN